MDRPSIKIFISYAHDDEAFFKVFSKTLKSQLKTRKKFQFIPWDDDKIPIGSLYNDEIQKQLADCDLAILCISDGFLASDFIKAKEFGVLIKKFPNTVLAPLLISPCEYKSWDALAERQLFKPKGDKYDEATNEDFTFADLVRFNRKDGALIQNPNIDRYVKDFISKIEDALEKKTKTAAPKQPEIAKYSSNYITNNYPFFEKDSFFGRDELLKQVDDKLKTLEVPLLLSGIGGMGKTAVAVAYGKDTVYCAQYENIAWVDVTEDVFSNLFSTFHGNPVIPFEYSPDGDRAKDIASIMLLLKQVPGKNLLMIDNSNEEADLQRFISAWKKYQPGWKCPVTTRCENNAYKSHLIKLEVISLEAAEKLFKRYNDEVFDKDSFKLIYDYIGGHTFLIELLAKYGQESSTINSTTDLLAHIKSKGIKALNRNVIARRGQQQETDNLVSEFVLGLYNPLSLSEKEQEYMRYFSVLPATEIEFNTLLFLFGLNETEKENLDTQLSSLVKRGWLMRTAGSFKCHQIIQEICKEKLQPDPKNCGLLINQLSDLFQYHNTIQSIPFFEIGLSVANKIIEKDYNLAIMQLYLADRMIETGNLIDSFNLLTNSKNVFFELKEDNNIGICLERMGIIYQAQGKTENAMECFLQYNTMAKELSEKNPDIKYKNNLTISYSRLGNIYEAQGEMEKALGYYLDGMKIIKELVESNPDIVEFKNVLAISNQYLGKIYESQGEMEKALEYFLNFNKISNEIADSNPGILNYKNSLAISNQYLGNKIGRASCRERV